MKGKLVSILFIISAISLSAFAQKSPAPAKEPTATPRQQTETIVREYLLQHPEIIREALAVLEKKEAAERTRLAAAKFQEKRNEIFANAVDPTAGNPRADVSIVVFFDYACGYCRKTLPALNSLLEKDPSIRVVYKEFPILSDISFNAALAALAAGRQGKYVEFHNALLAAPDLKDESIKQIATQLALSYETLIKDMKDPILTGQLTTNAALASELDIRGTPAYIINDRIVPGAISEKSLARIVETERAKKKQSTVAIKE